MGRCSQNAYLHVTSFAAGAAALAPASLAGLAAAAEPAPAKRLKVVVVGAHPDDPETGCGGTIARYADLGHDVVALYLTRGEAGIKGKSHEEAAEIRTKECERACEILKCRPVFAGQIDGSTELDPDRYWQFREILEKEAPDVVYAHWPIDSHRDHRAASLLVFDTWLKLDKQFALYYFEVISGSQTTHFHPTDYVDIGTTEQRKRDATYAHASQDPDGLYAHHNQMNRFRGVQCGCKFGEAFVRHEQSRVISAL